jgi:uncharacterized membrane protein
MLQKGFLKPQEEKGTSRVKTSRAFLFAGVIVVLAALAYMMMNLQQAAQISNVCLPVMIAGIAMIFTGIWMNFFAQNRNRRR